MGSHVDWANVGELQATLYAPDDPDHPDGSNLFTADRPASERQWAFVLDYGDGALVIDGDRLAIATRLVSWAAAIGDAE